MSNQWLEFVAHITYLVGERTYKKENKGVGSTQKSCLRKVSDNCVLLMLGCCFVICLVLFGGDVVLLFRQSEIIETQMHSLK